MSFSILNRLNDTGEVQKLGLRAFGPGTEGHCRLLRLYSAQLGQYTTEFLGYDAAGSENLGRDFSRARFNTHPLTLCCIYLGFIVYYPTIGTL